MTLELYDSEHQSAGVFDMANQAEGAKFIFIFTDPDGKTDRDTVTINLENVYF